MNKTIVVASSEKLTAKNGHPYLKVTDGDGVEYAIFDDPDARLQVPFLGGEGSKVDIEYTMDGKYPHISKAVLLSFMPPQYTSDEKKLRSQVLSYTKDLIVAGKVAMTELFVEAEMMYRFVNGGAKC